MIIPKHTICDLCKQTVGENKRYFKIKSYNSIHGIGWKNVDNRTHHICCDCKRKFEIWLKGQEKEIREKK